MTKEERQLLLKDLCARLPYGVKIGHINAYNEVNSVPAVLDIQDYKNSNPWILINSNWLPYLRPMSSMTEEEQRTLNSMCDGVEMVSRLSGLKMFDKAFDYLNAHHLDYRGLIPMGLALEAKEGMYKTE